MEDDLSKKVNGSRQYSRNELKRFGEKCSNILPPASVVRTMFSYELECRAEQESLFHGALFQIARCEDSVAGQQSQMAKLLERMDKLERHVAAKDVEQRLASSKVRIHVQHEAVKACTGRMDGLESKLADVDKAIHELKGNQEKTVPNTASSAPASAAIPLTEADAQKMKDEIDVLFDDRDGIIRMIGEVNERVTKLEDNVRALTIQHNSRSPSTASPQLIPLETTNGDLIDISIPKGKPYVTLKENRPGTVRTFTPGMQWMQ